MIIIFIFIITIMMVVMINTIIVQTCRDEERQLRQTAGCPGRTKVTEHNFNEGLPKGGWGGVGVRGSDVWEKFPNNPSLFLVLTLLLLIISTLLYPVSQLIGY